MTFSRETEMSRYVDLVTAENVRQNLVASSTISDFAQRHIADSLQLCGLVPSGTRSWIDIGSGAGLPGIPVAITMPALRMTLIEPRTKRAEFLQTCVNALSLADRVLVVRAYAERVGLPPADVISARAVAPLPKLFAIASHLAHPDTIWLLPKGRTGMEELEDARSHWTGDFMTVPSTTSPDASIVVARNVQPKHVR